MKKSIKVTMVAALFLGVTAQVSASEVSGRADVKFMAPGPTDPVDPVDPEEPGIKPIEPVNPTDPKPPVYPGGPLRLNHVPTLSFGQNKLSGSQATYQGKLEAVIDKETGTATERASFVEVADLTGTMRGWTVKVASDGIFSSSNNHINGTIALKLGKVRGLNGMDAQKDKFPIANQEIVIGKDAPSDEVLKAEAGKGYNKWQVVYGLSTTSTEKGDDGSFRNPNVTLTIPEGQIIMADQIYTAKVVWTLEQGV